MYWSVYDTLLLVTGILTIGVAVLPFRVMTPRHRVTAAAIGGLLVVVSLILGNMPAFTYPSFVMIAPVFPVIAGGYFGFLQWKHHDETRQAAAAPGPAAASVPPAAPLATHGAPAPSAPAVAAVEVAAVQPAEVRPAEPTWVDAALAEARNPSTDAGRLAELAYEYPHVRAAVAAHPQAYPGLLEWLTQFPDDDIRAALAHRESSSL